MTTDDRPKVVARPPLLFLAALVLAVALDAAWPAPLGLGAAAMAGGIALGMAGAALVAWAAVNFRRAGTNLPTWKPTTAIVATGPYRFTRNPIYVGLGLILAGIGLAADNGWVLASLLPVFAVLHVGVVKREEAYLSAKFGEVYRSYQERVRRWL
jgi:protein-S-isoprenylcysteine O-methyltransferase Ste14